MRNAHCDRLEELAYGIRMLSKLTAELVAGEGVILPTQEALAWASWKLSEKLMVDADNLVEEYVAHQRSGGCV